MSVSNGTNYATEDQITVDISFPYFKQGDDFGTCDGNLEKFIEFHHNIIEHTQNILNMIPVEAIDYVKGDGDTHCCWLTGPKSVMNILVDNDLAIKCNYEEDNDHDYDDDISDEINSMS